MGAMAYAELAALRPKAGGEYVYLREAFGPLAGFLTGWTSFVAGFSGAMAASAIFLIVTLNRFIPASPTARRSSPSDSVDGKCDHVLDSHARGECGRHHRGAHSHSRCRSGSSGEQRSDTLKIVSLVVFIAFGLTAGTGAPSNLVESAGPVTVTGFLFAFIPVMFTYSGWNAAPIWRRRFAIPDAMCRARC
jgi:APA family basic amino acid/polyamine antiporter